MQQYIKYVLSLVLIFSNLSYAFSMHLCQGVVEQVKLNHLDNNSHETETSKSCCAAKKKSSHCEKSKKKDDCCKDISSSDKVVEKQIVKIQKLIPITFLASEILKIGIPILNDEINNQFNLLDFYVASNAPPNYILNSQLTFYEG
ncbi:HYC_CC_PP family protein [Empedobacter brevis]|uniref:HYC_CC_PP family protein n=1 Tax=Empedobacter brevis TaxID=247 RepID=UPI0039AE9E52